MASLRARPLALFYLATPAFALLDLAGGLNPLLRGGLRCHKFLADSPRTAIIRPENSLRLPGRLLKSARGVLLCR